MFDFGLGSTELLLVAVIALIVIGPKDLPRLLRTMGQYMRKVQGMAREFQNHLNEAAKEAGVDDVKKEVKGMTNFTVTADLDKQGAEIKKAVESSASKASPNGAKADGTTDGKDEPAKIEAEKPAGKPQPADKPAPARKPETASKSKASAKPKTATKAKPAAKPKRESKPAAKPKSSAKPKASTGRKADPARETAKS